LLKAKDRAGNITERKLTVIIDTIPPVIKKLEPNHGELVFTAGVHSLQAVLKDGESGVSKASLKINGQPAHTQLDKRRDVLTHQGSFSKDGRYEAELEAFDVAGNKVSKKWHFKVDTSRIVVDQSDFKVYLYKAGKVVHTLNVAVGMPRWPTPNGNWKVIDKQSMPTWRNPHTSWSSGMPHSIAPGPRNPLGLRAIYLSAPGIRIHGTSAYYSIGRRASHGCIRVRNSDIVGFFPKISVGTPVLIRP
jgi:lipoprotein-anchoring transpeptidase ErfK/SrfK